MKQETGEQNQVEKALAADLQEDLKAVSSLPIAEYAKQIENFLQGKGNEGLTSRAQSFAEPDSKLTPIDFMKLLSEVRESYIGQEEIEGIFNNFAKELSKEKSIENATQNMIDQQAVDDLDTTPELAEEELLAEEEKRLKGNDSQSEKADVGEKEKEKKKGEDSETEKKDKTVLQNHPEVVASLAVLAFLIPGIGPLVSLAIGIAYANHLQKGGKKGKELEDIPDPEVEELKGSIDSELKVKMQQGESELDGGALDPDSLHQGLQSAGKEVVHGVGGDLDDASAGLERGEGLLQGVVAKAAENIKGQQDHDQDAVDAAQDGPGTDISTGPAIPAINIIEEDGAEVAVETGDKLPQKDVASGQIVEEVPEAVPTQTTQPKGPEAAGQAATGPQETTQDPVTTAATKPKADPSAEKPGKTWVEKTGKGGNVQKDSPTQNGDLGGMQQ